MFGAIIKDQHFGGRMTSSWSTYVTGDGADGAVKVVLGAAHIAVDWWSQGAALDSYI